MTKYKWWIVYIGPIDDREIPKAIDGVLETSKASAVMEGNNRNPVRPGQKIQVVLCSTLAQQHFASDLHDHRNEEIENLKIHLGVL